MKIAVTYDRGNVFQHFGQTTQFKIYEVEDKNVVSQEITDTNGDGHGALAGFLTRLGVNINALEQNKQLYIVPASIAGVTAFVSIFIAITKKFKHKK